MLRLVVLLAAFTAFSGCIHTQLTKNSHGVTESLADVHQQQVLDNLAMFASDLGALAYFAYASQGTASVNDQTGLSATNLLTRQCQEQWQLTPVNDSRKLELMGCVYQRVIALHRSAAVRADCPNCERLLRNFYSGDPEVRVDQAGSDSVTVECLSGSKWLAIGCGRCAKRRRAALTGRYGDVWVCVLPGKREELTKLTLLILDYALHDPPSKSKKSVAFHLNEHGVLSTADKAILSFTGDIDADEPGDSLVTHPDTTALKHLCAANRFGLTIDVLLGLDRATLQSPDSHFDLRERYHISDADWQEIRRRLLRIAHDRVDSYEPSDTTRSGTTADDETLTLPSPPTTENGAEE